MTKKICVNLRKSASEAYFPVIAKLTATRAVTLI